MLIRALTAQDIPAWTALSHEWDEIIADLMPDISLFFKGFDDYMTAKIAQNEAVMAQDRISNRCLGVIAFSQMNNRISYFGVSKSADFNLVGSRIMEVALNQLDPAKEIAATVLKADLAPVAEMLDMYKKFGFVIGDDDVVEEGAPARLLIKPPSNNRRGYSFHHDYPGYLVWSNEKDCPFCRDESVWSDHVLISELEHSYVRASFEAQGCLWGKCVIQSKKHYVEIFDVPAQELAGLMSDVQRASKALKEVSGAAKINLELHGNTIPHLHVHLFPRYLDDLFAAKAIDYTRTEPSPYESKAEFDYFVERMREKLAGQG